MVRTKHKKKIREMTASELASSPDGIVIAWNFIRMRESLGLTQEQVADIGGVTVSYIGKIETAAVSFGTRAQQKWSAIFRVDRPEFLKRPDAGVGVIGDIMEKGVIREYEPGAELQRVPLPPGYTQERAEREGVFCLRVSTDALHPHLRRDSHLYIIKVPISTIRNDNLVIYAERGEPAGIKEVEWLADDRVLLKGLGRGGAITKETSEISTVHKVVFIGM
ncbi:MAG: helix-turn-helix transcriptional regulator [Syntrophorhabdales bacterium]|jgi:transcriptional regulator with XRE-family HTH domain